MFPSFCGCDYNVLFLDCNYQLSILWIKTFHHFFKQDFTEKFIDKIYLTVNLDLITPQLSRRTILFDWFEIVSDAVLRRTYTSFHLSTALFSLSLDHHENTELILTQEPCEVRPLGSFIGYEKHELTKCVRLRSNTTLFLFILNTKIQNYIWNSSSSLSMHLSKRCAMYMLYIGEHYVYIYIYIHISVWLCTKRSWSAKQLQNHIVFTSYQRLETFPCTYNNSGSRLNVKRCRCSTRFEYIINWAQLDFDRKIIRVMD